MATPVRTCLACRRTAAKAALVRLTWRPHPGASTRSGADGGAVAIDPLAQAPGRGAYLCTRPECLERALRRRGALLTRALRIREGEVDSTDVRRQWQAAVAGRRPAEAAGAATSAATGRQGDSA